MRYIYLFVLPLFMACSTVAQQPMDVVILGDSNTWIGGDDCDQPRGWNKWFNDTFQPATCKSYARSGATWTNTTETRRNTEENIGVLGNDNVIFNQICRLEEAISGGQQASPRLILIMAGTNDAWFTKARPRALSMTAEEAFIADTITDRPVWQVLTLAESVRYGCELLRTAWPEARIILLTPLQSVAAGTANITKAGDIIEDCGRQMGLSVIRLDQNGGIDAKQEKQQYRLTTDGTHTSELGARQVGTFIAQQIAALLQI
ncbi:MAG: SGNH/GDSL hydrolase family protein [Prevotella sp.]|nr:SGNH/GDSL hydrolase family protein [Prevotella sp.]MBR0166069.1 SGNH/GDSL hydrolase family protein [Prevotella sp.]